MSDRGFIQIPRSILQDPQFESLPLTYKMIFFKILELMAYKPMKFDIHGNLIDLAPGQVCISNRKLAQKTGDEVSYKQVERALERFVQILYMTHNVSHDRNVLTITHPDICNQFNSLCVPPSVPGPSQDRPIKEESKKVRKNLKTKKDIRTDSDAHLGKILFLDRIYLTQKEHDDLALECADLWPAVLQKLNSYIPNKKGEPYKCHASAIRQWVIKAVTEDTQRVKTFTNIQKKPSHMHVEGSGKTYPIIKTNEENL